MRLAKIFRAIDHTVLLSNPSVAYLSYRTPAVVQRSTISFQSIWPTVTQNQTSSKVGGNLQDQRFKVKYSGFLLHVSELIICRNAASRHPKTSSPSQKPTSASNTTVSQAIVIQEQSRPGSVGTSLPSSKQYSRGQKKICALIASLTMS